MDIHKNTSKLNVLYLNMLKPIDMNDKINHKMLRTIIGTKRKHYGLGVPIMSEELANELHKPIRRNFKKRRVISNHVDDIWAADLVDMQYYSRSNKGFKYILMVIDVFSKYGWAIPLKNKSAAEIVCAFTEIWNSEQKPPKFLWTDKGKEFDNKKFRKLLEEKNVHMYWTENEEKSSVVERWNRTIKSKMWRYFTKNRTGVYIDVLPEIIEKYNNTYHHSIKCTPSDARKQSMYQHVFNALYNDDSLYANSLRPPPKYKIGDQVRISKLKKKFEKGYTANWTEEVFIIQKVQSTIPYTYKLKDTKDEIVKGTFYEPELQLAKQTTFRIEKVLRRRTNKDGKREIYVKWVGYSPTFNQWILEKDFDNEY